MKMIIQLFVIFICLDATAQSKKETIDWLNGKFSLNTSYVIKTGEYTFPYTCNVHINENGTFVIKTEELSFKDYHVINTQYAYGNIQDFNPGSAKIYNMDEYFSIQMNCTNSKSCVKRSGGYKVDNHNSNGIGLGVMLRTNDADFANRMLKAVKHLITLFGGKKEAF